jgi:hypothetical protein
VLVLLKYLRRIGIADRDIIIGFYPHYTSGRTFRQPKQCALKLKAETSITAGS